jgi:hypothetical protein
LIEHLARILVHHPPEAAATAAESTATLETTAAAKAATWETAAGSASTTGLLAELRHGRGRTEQQGNGADEEYSTRAHGTHASQWKYEHHSIPTSSRLDSRKLRALP